MIMKGMGIKNAIAKGKKRGFKINDDMI